jgi:hypothetical protein
VRNSTFNFNLTILNSNARNKSRIESRENFLLALLLPFFSPESRADAESHLLHILASVLISSILQTEKPFVVPIPTMVSLVLSAEPRVTRGGSDVCYNLNSLLLLITDFRGISEDILVKLSHVIYIYLEESGGKS